MAGVAVYIVLRLLAYFFPPGHILNSLMALAILIIVVYLLLKKDNRGWYLVAGEIILGGIGGFLAISGLSLRTLLLICSLPIFVCQMIKDKQSWPTSQSDRTVIWLLVIMGLVVGLAVGRGYYLDNDLSKILADTVPYLFLLYFFPLKKLWSDDQFKRLTRNLLVAAVIGSLIFVLFTFIIYSTGLGSLPDSYYRWFRDVAGGKITDLNNNFYRVVINEQLMLIPLLLYYMAELIRNKKTGRVNYYAAMTLIIILSINLTRIYWLALPIGLLVLFSRSYWKRWLAIVAMVFVLLAVSFSALHLAASRGQSLGWELFGLRWQAVAKPRIDQSALSRMLLLPPIWEKITRHPLLGHGLGETVTVYNPIVKTEITTTQFDWGYLEIIAEMGLVGLLVWLIFIGHILARLQVRPWLAILVSFLFINLTSPALFHVMGIILLTVVLTFNHQP